MSDKEKLRHYLELCIRNFEWYSNNIGVTLTEYHWRSANELILLCQAQLKSLNRKGE